MFSSFFNQQKKKKEKKSLKKTSSCVSSINQSKMSKKKTKIGKRKRKVETETTTTTSKRSKEIPFHPFKSEFGDHFSTSNVALGHVVSVLKCLRDECKGKFRVYDPFYCDGSVKRRLEGLGFRNVIHENRDFYADVKSNRVPNHDVLVTNPPYSSTHKIRILEYALTRNFRRPFALLLPSYVVSKQWYKNAIQKHLSSSKEQPFFVVPKTKYEYEHPTGKGHESSPFESLWIVCAWERTEEIYCRSKPLVENSREATMYRTPMELEKGHVIKLNRKRGNPRVRRKKAKIRSSSKNNI